MKFDSRFIWQACQRWAQALHGIEHPWLCWKVDDDWCLVQQKLVRSVGWTPVVGFDPRSHAPNKLVDGAIVVDFNEGLNLPVMYPHFPLEFVFRFCDRLAFWHSDLLLRKGLMEELASKFKSIRDGETIATRSPVGLRDILSNKRRRYWELVGCTTRAASLSQFQYGCGWWMHFQFHPKCPNETEIKKRNAYYWDHGSGIYYWHKECAGDVTVLTDKRIHEGHFTKIGNPNYKRSFLQNTPDAQRVMGVELVENFDLVAVCAKMGLSDLLSLSR
jgi:hypothetical protein